MVTQTLPRSKLFSWSTNFDVDVNGNVVTVHFHTATDSYRVQLNAATVSMAKDLITQIKTWMNQSDTWTGTILEHWQLQDVVKPSETVKEWVKIP